MDFGYVQKGMNEVHYLIFCISCQFLLQVLYLKEVDTMLALVCITRSENFRKKSLINYNIGCLKKALRALVQEPTVEN
jgi:hypothetical protein